MTYPELLQRRRQFGEDSGFEPTWFPEKIFDFQRDLVRWAVLKGRAGLYESVGLGKSIQEGAWAENVIRHENKPVLLLTPLAVGPQMVRELEKFGIEAVRSRDGKHTGKRVIEWLRRTTGVDFNSEQVKRNRQLLDCPADRGVHRAKRGKVGPVTIRRARE